MKAYIIATQESFAFIEKIRSALHGISVKISNNLGQFTRERISSADMVLVIVDHSFINNPNLRTELTAALSVASNNNYPFILPIILDNAPIPFELQSILCAKCDSSSDADIQRLALQVRRFISENQLYINYLRKKDTLDKNRKSISFLSVLVSLFTISIIFLLSNTHYSSLLGDSFNILIISSLVTVAISLIVAAYLTSIRQGKRIEEKADSEFYSQKLKDAITPAETTIEVHGDNNQIFTSPNDTELDNSFNKANKTEIDALGRMLINLEDIKAFYTWSQKQAKDSFILAVSMCIGGFTLMVAAILLPILFGLSIQTSIVPAVGGAIAELVAGTALFVYRNSLTQLNHYHKALHEDERFLSSVNLITKFNSTDLQDEMLKEIIRSEIQMNLISVSTNDFDSTTEKKKKRSTSGQDKERKSFALSTSAMTEED